MKAIRWILVTVLILLLAGGGVWAYKALTSTGEVTIDECLSFVGSNTFSVSMYPQGIEVVNLTIANASPDDIAIDLISSIVPDPGPNMSITIPNKVTVPAVGQVVVDITISAGKSAAPQTYVISIEVDR